MGPRFRVKTGTECHTELCLVKYDHQTSRPGAGGSKRQHGPANVLSQAVSFVKCGFGRTTVSGDDLRLAELGDRRIGGFHNIGCRVLGLARRLIERVKWGNIKEKTEDSR